MEPLDDAVALPVQEQPAFTTDPVVVWIGVIGVQLLLNCAM